MIKITHAQNIVCVKCKKMYSPDAIIFECAKCGGSLDIVYDYSKIKKSIVNTEFKRQCVSHWKYWPFYPINDLNNRVSLGEGGTPLIASSKIKDYSFKLEGCNPTGSFKDRGSTVEISKAVELKIREVACASTGNMGASVAAYCSRAGIKSTIYLPDFTPKTKVIQIKSTNSMIKHVKGSYEDAVKITKKLRQKKHVYLTGDYAYRGEGEKSVGFEIIDQLGWQIPSHIVAPVGNATLLSGIYKALYEMKEVGLIKKIPKLVAVQAKNCAPLVNAFNNSETMEIETMIIKPVKNPKTIATAIACDYPVDGIKALYALKKTSGIATTVTELEIISARKELAKQGIWVESSGAVSYAGARKLELTGNIVCVLTGSGLKEPRI